MSLFADKSQPSNRVVDKSITRYILTQNLIDYEKIDKSKH